MAGRLIGPWNPALDATGVSISGAKLYTYIAGTTTNLATYPTPTDADAGTNALANPVVADSAGRFAELWTPDGYAYDVKWTDAAGVQIKLFSSLDALGAPLPGVTHRSYLAGLTLSTAGSSASLSVAAGQATDIGNTTLIALSSALTKTTGAWSVGTNQGGLDTGAIANGTWYHFYLIERPDTGIVDVAFSTSASAPTTGGNIPSAYTLVRRIGSAKTNGSAQWVKFSQVGDLFSWDVPVKDINAVAATTTCAAQTLASVPPGVNVQAVVNFSGVDAGARTAALIHAGTQTAQAVGTPAGNFSAISGGSGATAACYGAVLTNTSQQVFAGADATTVNLTIVTQGWNDRRGRDS